MKMFFTVFTPSVFCKLGLEAHISNLWVKWTKNVKNKLYEIRKMS